MRDAVAVLLEAERLMIEAAGYFCPGVALRVDFSASAPVPGLPDREVKPLADPGSRDSYDRVLEQARMGGGVGAISPPRWDDITAPVVSPHLGGDPVVTA